MSEPPASESSKSKSARNSPAPGIKRDSKLIACLENCVETFLWNFRLIILMGVLGLLLSSLVVFCIGLFETFHMTGTYVGSLLKGHMHIDQATYSQLIVQIVQIVDDFLLGIVLLIFGLGTYDLFISRIDVALEQDDIRPDWLVFRSLDELKSVLGKVVLMIMIITFLKIVFEMINGKTGNFNEPVHLLYYGAGIALVALALKLSHGKDIDTTLFPGKKEEGEEKNGESAPESGGKGT